MNDLERRVKTALDADAAKAPRVSHSPEKLRRRVRRRQVGMSALVTLTVSAMALVSFAGFRAIERSSDNDRIAVDDPWAGYEVFERTAEVGNFTITSPSNWYLVNQWPWARIVAPDLEDERERRLKACSDEPTQDERQACRSSLMGAPGDGFVTPMILLGNTDRGLTSSPCFDPEFSVGPDEALMTIALDSAYFTANFGSGDRTQWPVPFDTSATEDRTSCGPGTYVYFASGDFPYVAHFAFGHDVPDDEWETLIRAFESMQVRDSPDILPREPERTQTSAAYVIAGGENTIGPWTLELRPQSNSSFIANVQLDLITTEGTRSQAGGPFTVPFQSIESSGVDPVFGAVSRSATGVEFRPSDGAAHIAGSVVPLPPTLRYDFDLFFIEGTDGAPGEVEPVGLPPDEMISRDAVPIRDVFNGIPYKVERRGSLDGRACVVVTIDDVTQGVCREPGSLLIEELETFRPFTYGAATVLVGVLPQDASASFTADGDRQTNQRSACAMVAAVWGGANVCALSVAAAPASGVVEITDLSGAASEQSVRWIPVPTPPRRVATGVTGDIAWALDYEEGRRLALVGDGDDILFDRIESNHMASLSRANPMLIGTHDFGSSDQPRYLLYGVTHHGVDQLSIVFGDGEVITFERGALHNPSIHIFGRFPNTSPGVWWAEMPPGPVVAEIVAFDTACEVIARSGLALQPPSPDTSVTAQATCVEGG